MSLRIDSDNSPSLLERMTEEERELANSVDYHLNRAWYEMPAMTQGEIDLKEAINAFRALIFPDKHNSIALA